MDNEAQKAAKKNKKKKMQKLDPSILGFSVHAAPDRVNIGEIDTVGGHEWEMKGWMNVTSWIILYLLNKSMLELYILLCLQIYLV